VLRKWAFDPDLNNASLKSGQHAHDPCGDFEQYALATIGDWLPRRLTTFFATGR
jgi:hypothetical protein